MFWFHGFTTRYTNVLHFRPLAGQVLGDPQVFLIGQAMLNFNGLGSWIESLGNHIELHEISVEDFTPGHRVKFFRLIQKRGTTGGRMPSKGACIVVTLRTNLLGRSGRGRVFLPVGGRSNTGVRFPSAANRNAAAGAISGLRTILRDQNDIQHVVYSPLLNQMHDVQFADANTERYGYRRTREQDDGYQVLS